MRKLRINNIYLQQEYKGYSIDKDILGKDFYTVSYEGEEFIFKTIDKAKEFIDEITTLQEADNEIRSKATNINQDRSVRHNHNLNAYAKDSDRYGDDILDLVAGSLGLFDYSIPLLDDMVYLFTHLEYTKLKHKIESYLVEFPQATLIELVPKQVINLFNLDGKDPAILRRNGWQKLRETTKRIYLIMDKNTEFYTDVIKPLITASSRSSYKPTSSDNDTTYNNNVNIKFTTPNLKDVKTRMNENSRMRQNRLSEAFNDSFPDWLVRRLTTMDKTKLSNRGVDLTNATYKTGFMPKGLDNTILPVYKISSDFGYDSIYIPGVIDPEILINGRWRRCSKLGARTLQELAVESGYIDMTDSSNTNTLLRAERAKAKEGSIERGKGLYQTKLWSTGEMKWINTPGEDKSGYKLDPTRLVKKLHSLNQDGFASQLDTIYDRIENCRSEIILILSNLDLKTYEYDAYEDKNAMVLPSHLERAIRSYRILKLDIENALKYEDADNLSDMFTELYGSDVRKLQNTVKDLETRIQDIKANMNEAMNTRKIMRRNRLTEGKDIYFDWTEMPDGALECYLRDDGIFGTVDLQEDGKYVGWVDIVGSGEYHSNPMTSRIKAKKWVEDLITIEAGESDINYRPVFQRRTNKNESLSDFDEKSFDRLYTAKLRESYSNVKAYNTLSVRLMKENKLVVTGRVILESGDVRATHIILELKGNTYFCKNNEIKHVFNALTEAKNNSLKFNALTEATKKDLSKVNHSITATLEKNISKLNTATTKEELYDIVEEILTNNNLMTEAGKRLLDNIKLARSYEKALSSVWSSMLYGEGNGVISSKKRYN